MEFFVYGQKLCDISYEQLCEMLQKPKNKVEFICELYGGIKVYRSPVIPKSTAHVYDSLGLVCIIEGTGPRA